PQVRHERGLLRPIPHVTLGVNLQEQLARHADKPIAQRLRKVLDSELARWLLLLQRLERLAHVGEQGLLIEPELLRRGLRILDFQSPPKRTRGRLQRQNLLAK